MNSRDGEFQIYPCTQSPSGDVTLKTELFYYSLHKETKHILFIDLSKEDITMKSSKSVCVFDQKVYSMCRDTVLQKLGKKQQMNRDVLISTSRFCAYCMTTNLKSSVVVHGLSEVLLATKISLSTAT